MTGYCMRCKERRDMRAFESTTMKNGRPAVRGKCAICGAGMFKIVSAAEAEAGAD